jgi:hypothetical protein
MSQGTDIGAPVGHIDLEAHVAKNTLADRRISFVLSNSKICFFKRLSSACASDDISSARPVSIRADYFHSSNGLLKVLVLL